MPFAIKKQIVRAISRILLKALDDPALEEKLWEVANHPQHMKKKRPYDIRFHLYRRASEQTAEYVEKRMIGIQSFNGRYPILDHALSQAEKEGLYLEFGVATGKSSNFIAERCPGVVHGFDSFQGLPESWIDGAGKGRFSSSAQLPPVRDNVQLHAGWFDDTLPGFVKEHEEDIAFLHVDCDLYSSTKTVFKFLGDRIKQGTVIAFDEYFNYPGWRENEFKAFQEFVAENDVEYTYLGYNRRSYQVAVRIDKIRD